MDSFITKYKAYYIDDFYFNDNIKAMTRLLLEMDDVNILFLGNSKSGKTTLLYALIREYYGLSKTAKFPENNILFINNLKEQGINYFRSEMKTFCQSQSLIRGKKKIIAIDDIDMINQHSQQVFCNYIDKYKENVCFISVCSNIHKIIENIQSRIHILKIEAPSRQNLITFMEKVVKEENMEIDEDSKKYLLLISNYSLRALMNHLEKIFIYLGKNVVRKVSFELCKNLCSTLSFQRFEEYVCCIKESRTFDAIHILYSIYDYGYSVIDILDYFFLFVKITEMLKEEEKYKITHYLCKYITIFHTTHEDSIELALFTNNIVNIVNVLENKTREYEPEITLKLKSKKKQKQCIEL